MPTTIKTNLRDRTLTGTVTTADLIPISQLLMNADEKAAMFNPDAPDPILAAEMLQDRLQKQVTALTAEYGGGEEASIRANETIMTDWIKKLMVVCESDLQLRTLILARLLEIFPEIPNDWISYDPVTQLASHRLEFDELLIDLILVVYTAIAQDDQGAIKARGEKRTARAEAMTKLLTPPTTTEAKPTTEHGVWRDGTMEVPLPQSAPAPQEEDEPEKEPGEGDDAMVDVSRLSPTQRMALLRQLGGDNEPKSPNAGLLSELAAK